MSNKVLTVSAVNKYLKSIIESDVHLKHFSIVGELSNVKYHSNGNVYFSIKDNDATISCIMFSSYANKLDFKLSEGDMVELVGAVYVYIKGGQYNINIKSAKKYGVGDLMSKYNDLKNMLTKEGYFLESRKKKLPLFVKQIGLITSDTGAAIEDMITTIKRRYPIANIDIFPTLVQGNKSKYSIVKNIQLANKIAKCDVLIVGRGGGSIEDLWAFNEEIVVKAIYESKIPIVSSVGHETDTTLADFAADKRAPTPTAAAEFVTPNILELTSNISQMVKQMSSITKRLVDVEYSKLDTISNSKSMVNPLYSTQVEFDKLSSIFNQQLFSLGDNYKASKNSLNHLYHGCVSSVQYLIEKKQTQLVSAHKQIDILNPLEILSRGYTITYSNNKIVKDSDMIDVNDIIITNLASGDITSKVISKEKNE